MGAPGARVRCLLVYPRFSEFSFWNYSEACRLAGYRYPTSPLGLLTVAALLPPGWECRLVDLNARELDPGLLDWADVVMMGGMITQQLEMLRLIRLAHSRGKPVALGGPDPTSQPEVYGEADFLVLDEGEITLPQFVAAWEAGRRSGVFRSGGIKPDLTQSPVPRFDLVRFEDYTFVGVQFSRGCPYTCEFCDIIELYGRVPRIKTPDQVLGELEALYRMGFRGHVDFVDDNFMGNKRAAKELLERLRPWSEARGWPFYFSTEATVTLAQDAELLGLMRACDFRSVFLGIETPDPELLRQTRKKQNTLAPAAESVRRIHEAGIMVLAGFIVGFDAEAPGAAAEIVRCIEEAGVCVAMVGLLTALPNTQLNRRLLREGRLFYRDGGAVLRSGDVDQMTSGLNFVTRRPRSQVLAEYRDALARLYSPEPYFRRIARLLRDFGPAWRHRTPAPQWPRAALAFLRISGRLLRDSATRGLYLRTLAEAARSGAGHFSMAVMLSAMYLHFRRQTAHVVGHIDGLLGELASAGEEGYLRRNSISVHPPASADRPASVTSLSGSPS